MGNYKKNPEQPFEVKVPNKIRKRITMHVAEVARQRELKSPMERILSLPLVPVVKKRGSLWSRLASGVAKMFQIKPSGVRE